MKIILLVLGFILVYWILKIYRRGLQRRGAPAPAKAGEDMVRCERCGVHLPRSESLMSGQVFYCTPEHRRQHQKKD